MSKRVEYKVEQLLKNGYKRATPQQLRDSNKALLLAVWDQAGLYLTDQQKAIFMQNCEIAETVTRARRKLKAKYPASPKVDEQRYQQYKEFTAEYSPRYQPTFV